MDCNSLQCVAAKSRGFIGVFERQSEFASEFKGLEKSCRTDPLSAGYAPSK
jgi:hypothetical protein